MDKNWGKSPYSLNDSSYMIYMCVCVCVCVHMRKSYLSLKEKFEDMRPMNVLYFFIFLRPRYSFPNSPSSLPQF